MEFNETKTWQPDEPNTFIIRVQHRQNASWQGSVQWVEGGKEQHFRSAGANQNDGRSVGASWEKQIKPCRL